MTIFEAIGALAFTKQPIDSDELEGNVPPYMLQRWLSMLDPFVGLILNDATNKYHLSMDTTDDWLKCFGLFVPKMRRTKITYLKKPVKDDPDILDDCDNPKNIEAIAELLQVSRREAQLMLQMSPELLKLASDDTQSFRKVAR